MKRFRRHSHRQALIDACRLIGYTIEPAADKWGPYTKDKSMYVVVNPAGNVLRVPGGWTDNQDSGKVMSFRFMWQAAAVALTREGVNIDALKPSREERRTERAARKVRRKRNKQERAARRVAEAQAARERDRGVSYIVDIESYPPCGGQSEQQLWGYQSKRR